MPPSTMRSTRSAARAHACRVCGDVSQSFGHSDLCPQHFVEWLEGDYEAIMAEPTERWTVLVDVWLERRVGCSAWPTESTVETSPSL